MSERGARRPPNGSGGPGGGKSAPPGDAHPRVAGEQGRDMNRESELDVSRMLPPLDSAPGPARRLSSARSAAMVSAIVDEATVPLPETASQGVPEISPFEVTRAIPFEPSAEPERRRKITRSGAMLTAALVMAMVSSAAAGIWVVVRERRPGADSSAAASGPGVGPEHAGRARLEPGPASARVVPDQVPDRPAEAQEETRRQEPAPAAGEPRNDETPDGVRDGMEDEVEGPARPAEVDRLPAPRKRPPEPSRRHPRPDAQTGLDREQKVYPSRRAASLDLPANAGVEDIVALANQRRKEKRWRDAAQLYERVIRDYGGTDAAAIATVASASLHLDHLADPEGALQRFRQALRLRPDGPLAEEARWGLAETHRALGDEEAERAALRGFLSAHPRSVNAPRARQRLAQLGTGP